MAATPTTPFEFEAVGEDEMVEDCDSDIDIELAGVPAVD